MDSEDNLYYGAVVVTHGEHKGRIGYYDNEWDASDVFVEVLFGQPLFCKKSYKIKRKNLSNDISTASILERITKLNSSIMDLSDSDELKFDCLNELYLADGILLERYERTRLADESNKGAEVFISYATANVMLARTLKTDLSEAGYHTFMADWSISLGENIIERISMALDTTHILIIVVSKEFLGSVFCLDEWTSFYMRFAKSKRNSIIPIIIDSSKAPTILSSIKYYDLTNGDYNTMLSELLRAINGRSV